MASLTHGERASGLAKERSDPIPALGYLIAELPDLVCERSSYGMSNARPALFSARQIIEEWRIDYNTNRPHSSLNGLTPTEFAARPTEGHNRNRFSL
jgi:transposase InsO family protein